MSAAGGWQETANDPRILERRYESAIAIETEWSFPARALDWTESAILPSVNIDCVGGDLTARVCMQLALRGSRIHRDRLSYGENASWRMLAMTLQDFIRKYPPTGPRRPATNADELRQLGPDDGVLLLTGAPAAGPTGQPDGAQGRHLWVFRNSRQADLPYILELAPNATPRMASGVAKHTNLTAGGPASCGGELWIDVATAGRLYVNGCSGRYGAVSREHLDDAAQVFRDLGFEVVNYGWDEETQKPYCQYYR